jgi:hypothetical protein
MLRDARLLALAAEPIAVPSLSLPNGNPAVVGVSSFLNMAGDVCREEFRRRLPVC